jgi:hypothetical protein
VGVKRMNFYLLIRAIKVWVPLHERLEETLR